MFMCVCVYVCWGVVRIDVRQFYHPFFLQSFVENLLEPPFLRNSGLKNPWLEKVHSVMERINTKQTIKVFKATVMLELGFPCSSNGKESACEAGDQGSIPGLGSSTGEGNGNPLQHSCLEISMDKKPGGLQSVGWQRVRHDWVTNTVTQSQNTCKLLKHNNFV